MGRQARAAQSPPHHRPLPESCFGPEVEGHGGGGGKVGGSKKERIFFPSCVQDSIQNHLDKTSPHDEIDDINRTFFSSSWLRFPVEWLSSPPDSESVPPTALLLKLFLLLLSSCRVEREKTGFPPPINFSIASNPDSLPDTHSKRSLCKSPVSLGPVQQLCCLTAMLRMVAASVISLTKHFLPLTRYSLEAEGD